MLGEQYMAAVVALLDALENTQGVEVFGEWQHQEYLVSQLSCSLCSLVALRHQGIRAEEFPDFPACCAPVGGCSHCHQFHQNL